MLSKSYIQRYIKATSFKGYYQKDSQAIQIVMHGKAVGNQESAEFIELINHFGDNTYYKKFPSAGPNVAIANEFSKIEIISNKDFNSKLTSGKSLAEVVKLYSVSPMKFINSKYTKPFDWVNEQPYEFRKGVWSEYAGIGYLEGYYPVLKTLSELTSDDMLLLHPRFFYLRFTEIPTIKEHTFTITIEDEENSFTAVVPAVFE